MLLSSGGSSSASGITFSPPAGAYTGDRVLVHVTVTNAAKLRYKIDEDTGWITVPSPFVFVYVTLNFTGKTLFVDALSAGGAVLFSDSATYTKDS